MAPVVLVIPVADEAHMRKAARTTSRRSKLIDEMGEVLFGTTAISAPSKDLRIAVERITRRMPGTFDARVKSLRRIIGSEIRSALIERHIADQSKTSH